MAYIRPAKKKELVTWLENVYPSEDGYIYTSIDELAEKLLASFEVVGEFRNL